MSVTDWINVLLLGGMLGALGQGVRAVIGLKKVNDQAALEGRKMKDMVEASTLIISLLIGFIAGALAIIGIVDTSAPVAPDKELVLTLLGAGYAGTDLIEGFIKKYLPAAAQDAKPRPQEEPDVPPVG
jgi:hypothetical protein